MLEHFVVWPQENGPNDPNLIPEFLRTKVLPEMESEEQEMLQQYESGTLDFENDHAKKVATLQIGNEQYNIMCEQVEESYEDLKDQMSIKTKRILPTNENNQVALKNFLGVVTYGNGLRQAKQQLPIKPPTIFPATNPSSKLSQPIQLGVQDSNIKMQFPSSSILSNPQAKLVNSRVGIQNINATLNNQTIPVSNQYQNPNSNLVLQLQQHNLQRHQ